MGKFLNFLKGKNKPKYSNDDVNHVDDWQHAGGNHVTPEQHERLFGKSSPFKDFHKHDEPLYRAVSLPHHIAHKIIHGNESYKYNTPSSWTKSEKIAHDFTKDGSYYEHKQGHVSVILKAKHKHVFDLDSLHKDKDFQKSAQYHNGGVENYNGLQVGSGQKEVAVPHHTIDKDMIHKVKSKNGGFVHPSEVEKHGGYDIP
jgi:hypothetical protein